MRLKIVAIHDRGVPDKERLQLSVIAPANLVNYVVFETLKGPGDTIVPIPRNAYWFTPAPLRPGDFVVLYTRVGQPSTEKQANGVGTNHFLFWRRPSVIWADPNSCAVLLEVNDWVSTVG